MSVYVRSLLKAFGVPDIKADRGAQCVTDHVANSTANPRSHCGTVGVTFAVTERCALRAPQCNALRTSFCTALKRTISITICFTVDKYPDFDPDSFLGSPLYE